MKGACFRCRGVGYLCMLVVAFNGALYASTNSNAVSSTTTTASPAPASPREFYNAGTKKMDEAKWREAEAYLETALGSQQEGLQPPSLYNLGHVRFAQGVEELKKGPSAAKTTRRLKAAGDSADEAIREADAALAGDDLTHLVMAYQRGRGVRRELKAATDAVKVAMEKHRAALLKWQRSSGDFKSALELVRSDADANFNAEVMDRCIAKLVDSIRQMQSNAGTCASKKEELGEKMKQLKGRIPAQDMPPGAAGDDDEEEDQPMGKDPGQKEGPTKQGDEMALSPEQAGWLLQGFKLDADRRLPMGEGELGKPRDPKKPTW